MTERRRKDLGSLAPAARYVDRTQPGQQTPDLRQQYVGLSLRQQTAGQIGVTATQTGPASLVIVLMGPTVWPPRQQNRKMTNMTSVKSKTVP